MTAYGMYTGAALGPAGIVAGGIYGAAGGILVGLVSEIAISNLSEE